MLLQTRAIVLGQIAYNDRYHIAHLYSQEAGRIGLLVPRHQGRSKRSPRLSLAPLSELDFTLSLSPHRSLYRLGEAHLLRGNHAIAMTPIKRDIALFLSELLFRILNGEQADDTLYHYLSQSLTHLEHLQRGVANFHLCFLWGLLEPLGIMPDLSGADSSASPIFSLTEGCYALQATAEGKQLSREEATHLRIFARMTMDNMHAYRYNRLQRGMILDRLLTYYREHLPPFPSLRSLEVLRMAYATQVGDRVGSSPTEAG